MPVFYFICFILFVLISLVGCSDSIEAQTDDQNRRIFPAAVSESYASKNQTDYFDGCTLTRSAFYIKFQTEKSSEAEDFLVKAVERTLRSIFSALPDYPLDTNLYPTPSSEQDRTSSLPLTALQLQIDSADTELYHGVDESYKLIITNNNDDSSAAVVCSATMHSKTIFGALRGLETFSQLVDYGWATKGPEDHVEYTFLVRSTPILISDRPHYEFRGMMIDTARHYLPVSLILDNLNAMALNKLNVLHWHLTDSQSFPWVSQEFPELSQEGAYSPHHLYTRDDVQLVVREAYLRGIRVIPELDTPGHVAALGKSHAEFLTQCDSTVSWEPPLDPTNASLYEFLDTLFGELSDLFPDNMMHMGGDEVGLECWRNSTAVREWMLQHGLTNVTELYSYYEAKLLSLITERYNKRPIVWQEVFRQSDGNVSGNAVVDVWKGLDIDTILAATSQNRTVIVSGCWYLDYLGSNWRDFYNCKPWEFNGTSEQQSLVIGGKACMWGESVDASVFMSRVWPRASSMAERLWTGPVCTGEGSINRRIRQFRCYLLRHGINAQPVGPGICDREPSYRYGHWQDEEDAKQVKG